MNGAMSTGVAVLEWAQRFGILSSAIAICIGGYYLIWGGDRGRPKAIGFFIGAVVGLVIVMGAYNMAESINDNIKF